MPRATRKNARAQKVGPPGQHRRLAPAGKKGAGKHDRLLSNDDDIRKALHQAELTRRLIESGVSPYARFQEINQIAKNIARTVKPQWQHRNIHNRSRRLRGKKTSSRFRQR